MRNEREPIAIEELLNAYRKFRKFIPDILATIVFEGTTNGQDCLMVWEFIRQRFPRPVTYRMFEQIVEKLPKKWRYYIRENPQVTNQCVLIAGIELLVHGLKRHDIYVRQSNRYLDPIACLIDKSTWRQQKAVLIQQLDLPQTGQAAVEAVKQDLALSYAEALKNWADSEMAQVKEVDGQEKIIVAKLRKVREQKDEAAFKGSSLEPTQIMTDTAGYSDLVFGLFGLLGFQFSPRIANSQGTKLWRIDSTADYQVLNGVSQNRINLRLIEEHWEDILRVAGSLKSGKVNATELTQALQREGHPTALGKAITEYGKVYKTKHQLRYLSDEIYARQILEQLNKGEARHALCRNIFYGRKGKLYQTYFDGMEEQLNALSLVTNAIIYWNTVYLEKIVTQMQSEGFDCSDDMIGKLSPLMFEHINFVGKYTFQYNEALENGHLRPLDEADEK